MKRFLHCFFVLTLFYTNYSDAQWNSKGPYGAITTCSIKIGSEVYVGTNAGIYKSSDQGLTWIPVYTSFPSKQSVSSIYYDGTTMFVGLSNYSTYKQVYFSTNMGASWTAYSSGLLTQSGYTGFCKLGNRVYVSGWDYIYYTTNSGVTWTATASAPFFTNAKIYSWGNHLFVINYGSLVKRSDDLGNTWVTDSNGMGTVNPAIYTLYFKADTMFAIGYRSYYSVDTGNTWVKLPLPSTSVEKSGYDGSSFYYSTGGNTGVKVFKLLPGANSWVNVTNNLADGYTTSFFCIGTTVFIDKEGVLYKSTDGGSTWINTGNIGMTGKLTSSVFANDNIVLGGSQPGAFRSIDNGNTWMATGSNFDIYSKVNHISYYGNKYYALIDGDGLYASADTGKTWTKSGISGTYLYSMTSDGTNFYVGGDNGTNVVLSKSTNGGTIWNAFNTGLPSDGHVFDMVILGNDIYVTVGTASIGTMGIYKSSLSSPSFKKRNNGIGNFTPKVITTIGNTIYTGVLGKGIYLSSDTAATWTTINAGLLNLNVNALINCNGNLVAGTDSGVYYLKPGGSSWTPLNIGLNNLNINKLSFNSGYLFAATNASIWQIPMSFVGINFGIKSPGEINIYPNPAREKIFISGIDLNPGDEIIIMDNTGKKVMGLNLIINNPWFSIEGIDAGIYFITIRHSDLIFTRKIIITD